MKNILVFDTATIASTVALKTPKGVFSRHEVKANIHARTLLNMLDEILEEAEIQISDVDVLGVGVGPGSFTGLRIGVGVAQGLAYSSDIKLVPISTLEMIALNAVDSFSEEQLNQNTCICVGHDARMSEVYSSSFDYTPGKRLLEKNEPIVFKPDAFSTELIGNINSDSLVFHGNAWAEYESKFSDDMQELIFSEKTLTREEDFFPRAEVVVSYLEHYLSDFEFSSCLEILPTYVRDDVAKKSTKVK